MPLVSVSSIANSPMASRSAAQRTLGPLLALGLLATPASAQEPAVPQTFDWWEAAGVPSSTPWGQSVDVESTEQILSWTTMEEYISQRSEVSFSHGICPQCAKRIYGSDYPPESEHN